jgi:hypothetical protein
MDDEDLYDEFGNYIGPAVPDDDDEDDGDDDDDDELEAAFAGRCSNAIHFRFSRCISREC